MSVPSALRQLPNSTELLPAKVRKEKVNHQAMWGSVMRITRIAHILGGGPIIETIAPSKMVAMPISA